MDPTPELSLGTPVLAGGDSRQWRRRLRFAYDDRDRILHPMYAKITFTNIDGEERTNQWPRVRRDQPQDADVRDQR